MNSLTYAIKALISFFYLLYGIVNLFALGHLLDMEFFEFSFKFLNFFEEIRALHKMNYGTKCLITMRKIKDDLHI